MTTVLVHPGSLFGSANCTVGKAQARWVRKSIFREDVKPAETLFVLEGVLSEEFGFDLSGIEHYKLPADPNTKALRTAAQAISLVSEGPYLITGAWLQKNGQGCVDTVVKGLRAEGYVAHASRFALQLEEHEPPHELWEPTDFRA